MGVYFPHLGLGVDSGQAAEVGLRHKAWGSLLRLAESGKETDLAPHHTSPSSSSPTREDLTQAELGPSFLRTPWQPESPHKRAGPTLIWDMRLLLGSYANILELLTCL